ncbi:MAG: hypothetical protein JGK20_28280 [Microcoleus sp. PH2017_05_CCC_O_A]|nr:hypothetical protein [Microcoleus sp. PH2017_05_CCC_O_A]
MMDGKVDRTFRTFGQFSQKVDRTFRTMQLKRSIALLAQWNSKGRSHLLHNLLKRSIALITQFTQKVDRTFRQFSQKVDRTFRQSKSKTRSPRPPQPASVSDHKADRSEAGRKPSPSLPKNLKICQIK